MCAWPLISPLARGNMSDAMEGLQKDFLEWKKSHPSTAVELLSAEEALVLQVDSFATVLLMRVESSFFLEAQDADEEVEEWATELNSLFAEKPKFTLADARGLGKFADIGPSSKTILVGCIDYTDQIRSIWAGVASFYRKAGIDLDFVLFTSYDRQVEALLGLLAIDRLIGSA
ncbi:unnamed protein product [Effrenium voratum]|nr:unnamed protein product [Effrenium voratum]